MRGTRWLLALCAFLCVSMASAQTLLPRKYPSARVAFVNTGGEWQTPTDQEAIDTLMALYGRANGYAVKLWERDHADILAGGGLADPALNAQTIATEYAYLQSIYTQVNGRDSWLRMYALARGWDYEDFALHYREDTYIDLKAIGATGTVLYGRPNALGYTPTWANSCYSSLNRDDVLGSGAKDGMWVMVPEPVAEVYIAITSPGERGPNGEVVVEYVSGVNQNYSITEWKRITIVQDGTNGFTQSGWIRWIPPSDWKWCIPNPPHNLGSASIVPGVGGYIFRVRALNYAVTPKIDLQFHRNQPFLRQVLQLVNTSYRTATVLSATSNTVRIQPTPNNYKNTDHYKDMTVEIVSGRGAGQVRTVTASSAGWTPTLTVSPNWDVVPDTTSVCRITGPTVMVPGWDPANDANGDGYVDDTEFANRPNPNASARFRWEARATTGAGWAATNATCRMNLLNPQCRQALVEYYLSTFNPLGLKGYFNDDALALVSADNFPVLHGGRLQEYSGAPIGQNQDLVIAYRDAFLQTHQAIRQGGMQWVGTNISQENMFVRSYTRGYIGTFNLFLCEQVIMDSQPLSSWSGLLRIWFVPAYAAAGVRSVVMALTAYNNYLSVLGNTREAWERLTENKLAMYYLIQVPEYVFFHNWNRTYWYGSFNTVVGTGQRGFWRGGVPQNMAYTPVKMLRVDIGMPANTIPEGYQPIEYILGVNDVPGASFYTKVGNSTQTTLNVPTTEGTNINVPIVPTHAFYLWRTSAESSGLPNDSVVARMYTKGLVLCRMPGIAPPTDYTSYIANAITVQLPAGPYRRVNYDGTLGPPVNEIQIRGYEGIVLVKAASVDVPNVQLTLSVDKPNPKPLDVVTVTVVATNTGTGAARNVEVTVPLSNMTYEQGSLSPSDCTADASERDKLKIRVPNIAPGETKEIRFRAVVRRGE